MIILEASFFSFDLAVKTVKISLWANTNNKNLHNHVLMLNAEYLPGMFLHQGEIWTMWNMYCMYFGKLLNWTRFITNKTFFLNSL